MRFRFRDKLVLAFAALLLATIVPVLVLVNSQIDRISEAKIEQDLRNTGKVFQSFQEGQLAAYSDKTTNFILTQPEIRAEIATVGGVEAQFGKVFNRAESPALVTGSAAAPASPASPGGPGGQAAPTAGSDPFGAVSAGAGQTFGSGAPTGGSPGGAGAPAAGAADPFGAVTAGAGQTFGAGASPPSRPRRDDPSPKERGQGSSPLLPLEKGGRGDEAPAAPSVAGAGSEPSGIGQLPERQNLILSIVEEVGLYRESAVFFLTDFRGTLIFDKADPRTFGTNLAQQPEVRAALAGNEVFTWWGSLQVDPAILSLLPAAGDEARLYQMFLKPLVFGGEVKGLIGIGFPFTAAELERVIGIAQAEVAFLADDHVYVNSLADVPAAPLRTLAGRPLAGGRERLQRFEEGGEEYLTLPIAVQNTLGERVGTALVYRSKTREQAVFNRMRTILNAIGAAALAVAGLLAWGISHQVARVVRQLFHGVSAVRAGDLDVHLEIRSRDEFGELGRAFNEMTAGLKEKEQIRSTFKRYVSSTVVDELLRSADSVKLGGEAKQLTIQFSDIAGFTSISEALSPEQVVEFLNTYLSQMTGEVEAESGIVDKYIGDAVMAFWGAPLPLADHADHACRAALRQIRRVAALRESWAGRGELGRFNVRLGLHSGEVIVGNIGSDTRMDYTIIGDSVNTASRLEGMNKVYGTNILLSEDTRSLLRQPFVTRELDRIVVVGKSRPVRIYELAGLDGEVGAGAQAVHARFAEALAAYRERRFAEAQAAFSALADESRDAPAHTFARRCAEFQAAPPPEDWDGVYRSTSK
jgi:class 3 adenylate cyclase